MENVIKVFCQASADDIAEGAVWYQTAKNACQIVANNVGLELPTIVGIVSALSPQLTWGRNIAAAELTIEAYRNGLATDEYSCPAYLANRDKAFKILQSDNSIETIAAILNAKKTTAFFRCILDPMADNVVIDGHAANIVLGQIAALKTRQKITAKQYDAFCLQYFAATYKINKIFNLELSAPQVQAITWVTWRKIHAEKMRLR